MGAPHFEGSGLAFLSRIFLTRTARSDVRPAYDAAVALARDPAWYREGGVPDTLDGRFDMLAAVVALLLLRLEREGAEAGQESVFIAELFIEDMEGSVRQMGIGDLMVGKHVGRMMSALGGRIAAFRDAAGSGRGFEAAVRRNIFHDGPAPEGAAAFVTARLERLHEALIGMPAERLLAGELPRP